MFKTAKDTLDVICDARFAFFVAVALNILAVFAVGHYRAPALWENGVIARNLLNSNRFAIPLYKPSTREKDAIIESPADSKGSLPPLMKSQLTSNQAPGYPFLLLITWKLIGENSAAYIIISLLQAVLISSIVFPIRWLTTRWFGENAGILACWLVCLMPAYVWFTTRIAQPAIVIAFHPWLLAGWLKLTEDNSLRRSMWVGLGTGIAGLFQPVLLAVYGLLGLILLMKSWIKRSMANVWMLVLAMVLVMLVLVPWTVRNYRVHNQLVFVKSVFWFNFWIGNNPHATGTIMLKGGKMYVVKAAISPEYFTIDSEMEYMKALQRDSVNYVRSEPTAFVIRTLKKIIWFWTVVPRDYLKGVGDTPRLNFYWLQACYWVVFLLLAVFARLRHGRFRGEYSMMLIIYFIVYSMTYGLTHVSHARFRVEMEFLIIPAVAQGILMLWNIRNRFLPRRLHHYY